MEEQTEKLLPYELLLRKNNLQLTDLPNGTQQMIADIKKTLNMLFAKSSQTNGNVVISENTKNKIDTYDRHICNDILEYLDELEEKQEVQKEENSSSESHSQTTNNQTTTHTNNETKDSNENSGKIGFWNWE